LFEYNRGKLAVAHDSHVAILFHERHLPVTNIFSERRHPVIVPNVMSRQRLHRLNPPSEAIRGFADSR
jgi:hypothetical protein